MGINVYLRAVKGTKLKIKLRKNSWLVLPALFMAFAGTINTRAFASQEPGLTATVYNNFGYNGAPPLPADSGRPSVGEIAVSRVEQDFDQSPPFNLYEDFIVKYEGYITSPVSASIVFLPTADDGTKMFLDGVLIDNNWRDKGGGGNPTSPQAFTAGVSRHFTYWFYENGGGAWTTLYWDIGAGWETVPDSAFTKQAVSTTTTTLASYLNAPQNLVVTSTNESKVYLSWDAPEPSNTDVERYAIFWSCNNWGSGFAISSMTTSAVVENFEPEQSCQFKVRADNDSLSAYSAFSNEVNGVTLPATTTSTTTTSTTTTIEPETTTTSVFIFPTLPPVTTEEPVESTTTTEPVQDTILQQTEQPETTAPPVEAEVTQAEAAVAELDTENVSTTALANAVSDILDQTGSADELGSVVNDILDKPLSDEQFGAVIDEVFSEPLSTEQLSSVLEAVFDEPISDEKFDEVISAVLDEPLSDEQFAAVIDVLENESITEEQVASAVDAVLETGVTEDQATELATSEKVLQSIDGEQAAEIFDAVDISNVTPEEAAQLVEAVQNAPAEVRESMESEINVFDGAIDTYVPLGSAVDVGTRRVVVAAAAAAASMTMTVGGGGSSPSSPSSPSGGSGGGGSTPSEDRKTSNSRRRK